MSTFRKLRAFCRVLRANKLWTRRSKAPFWLRTVAEGQEGFVFCPLTYAYFVASGESISVCDFLHAGEVMGFDKIQAEQIAGAADGDADDKRMIKLRRILEKACGFK